MKAKEKKPKIKRSQIHQKIMQTNIDYDVEGWRKKVQQEQKDMIKGVNNIKTI